ncbi:MAG: hypothetical protein EOP02_09870 [Proteobacteria bacterium]|nr:MAG: hypothetical protein EOP02_09870 [Pseudomonadota bacterium]
MRAHRNSTASTRACSARLPAVTSRSFSLAAIFSRQCRSPGSPMPHKPLSGPLYPPRQRTHVHLDTRIGLGGASRSERIRSVGLSFIDSVAAAGCGIFFVHARNAWLQGLSPKENREVPPLRYDWAYRLKQERPHLTIAVNGGIATRADALVHLQYTDGVMLGRAAYHDPYLLHCLDVELFGGTVLPRAQLLRQLRAHVEDCLQRGVALKHITRHVLGLFHGQPGGRAFRQVLSEGAHKPGADWALVEQAIAATESHLRSAA